MIGLTRAVQDPRAVVVDERTLLVQLAPCCLDSMWDRAGRYDRAALASHLSDHHLTREVA